MSGAPASSDVSPSPARLRRRGDFVRATRSGMRASSPLFTVQMATRDEAPDAAPRFGFTVTKKVGGAVERNRIRRRLKAALHVNARPEASPLGQTTPCSAPLGAEPGRDYVFVARRAVLAADFADIVTQMTEGLARLNRGAARSRNIKNRPSAS